MEVEVDEGRGRVEDNQAVAEAKKEDYVVMAMRQMPRLGAQDWSGWRYDHIAALTKDQARWIVDIILNEEPEPEVRWMLTTAKVLPFEKEDGKARACIVGSMLRMFIARVVRLAMRIRSTSHSTSLAWAPRQEVTRHSTVWWSIIGQQWWPSLITLSLRRVISRCW